MSEQARRGRPPVTDVASLRAAALPLLEELGYEQVSMAELAGELGVSVRTLHRYFPSKADIVWGGIDDSITALTRSLQEAPDSGSLLESVAVAVDSVMRHNVEDLQVMRARIRLIARTPALRRARSTTFETWRQELIRFAARRLGQPPTALVPIALGSALHETVSQALGWWAVTGEDVAPAACLSRAFDGLATLLTTPPAYALTRASGTP